MQIYQQRNFLTHQGIFEQYLTRWPTLRALLKHQTIRQTVSDFRVLMNFDQILPNERTHFTERKKVPRSVSNLEIPITQFQNYSIIGENRTIGLYLLKLSKFKSIPSIRERVLLYKSNVFNTFSKTILLILADRYSDQVARRFVKAKLENTV